MITITNEEILYGFLEEYAEFFQQMVLIEKEKLASLISNDLARIEHSIAVQQATDKRLENIENRRLALQKEAGFPLMSFEEIIESSSEESQQRLWPLYHKLKDAISEIRFLNGKSMGVAEDKIKSLNSSKSDKARPKGKKDSYYKNQEDK